MANPAGISGSLLFILMHGLAKAGLFLCAGIVIHATHKRDIREMGGLIRTMPVTAFSFLFCAFSVIGIPPFGGFFSKFLVIMGTLNAGQTWLAATALFTAVLTMVYLLKVFSMVFLGEAKEPAPEKTPAMVGVVAVLAGLSLRGRAPGLLSHEARQHRDNSHQLVAQMTPNTLFWPILVPGPAGGGPPGPALARPARPRGPGGRRVARACSSSPSPSSPAGTLR